MAVFSFTLSLFKLGGGRPLFLQLALFFLTDPEGVRSLKGGGTDWTSKTIGGASTERKHGSKRAELTRRAWADYANAARPRE